MINKYLKYKKMIRSFLCLGVTITILGCFSFQTNYFVGIILFLIGLIFLFITYFMKQQKTKIEEECKIHCISCGKNIINVTEEKYYILNKPVDKELFNSSNCEKTKQVINYYKCNDCHLCLTVINTYLITNGKEKQLNDKINMDFDYNDNY